jgi:hypothetical protein
MGRGPGSRKGSAEHARSKDAPDDEDTTKKVFYHEATAIRASVAIRAYRFALIMSFVSRRVELNTESPHGMLSRARCHNKWEAKWGFVSRYLC